MRNFTCLLALAFGFTTPALAQFTTVNYDLERNWFNEGQPLPSEADMVFRGNLPEGTEKVELTILSPKRGKELYRAVWQKTDARDLSLIVPFKLREGEEYDLRLDFFRQLNGREKETLLATIMTTLDAYADINLEAEKGGLSLRKNSKKMLDELNQLLDETLDQYRGATPDWSPAFSELIRFKLEQLEKLDLNRGGIRRDTSISLAEARQRTRQAQVAELQALTRTEVTAMLNREIYVLATSRLVDNYPTEKKSNSLAITAGYGGVYISGDLDDLTYGASPYFGLAFPLGNELLGARFLRNTSITLGVFLDNFEDEKGRELTGFLVDRPVYLGLDHKLFDFIRLNAGATFLEDPDSGDDGSANIYLRPYIGLSVQFALNLRLNR